jgi:hypothetical protein
MRFAAFRSSTATQSERQYYDYNYAGFSDSANAHFNLVESQTTAKHARACVTRAIAVADTALDISSIAWPVSFTLFDVTASFSWRGREERTIRSDSSAANAIAACPNPVHTHGF